MSWRDYYRLLEQYEGDLSKATPDELQSARLGNPNDPASARRLAEINYWLDWSTVHCWSCEKCISPKLGQGDKCPHCGADIVPF